jgi:RNA polymerase sigma factor (sigma-70 family)
MDEPPETRPSLLARIRDPRDSRAWEEFLEIYGPLVHRLARLKGLQDADAHDLTQEVFRAVASAIDRWDPDPALGTFRGWLFRISRNLMVNFLIARDRHPVGSGDSDMRLLLEAQPAPDGAESALFDEEYRRRVFRWAADHVRPEFREPTWQAFWRTAVDGRPPREVAEALGQSVGAVYIARSRVLARLRAAVEGVEGLPGGASGR